MNRSWNLSSRYGMGDREYVDGSPPLIGSKVVQPANLAMIAVLSAACWVPVALSAYIVLH